MESIRSLVSIATVFLFIAVLVAQCRLQDSIEEASADLSAGAMYHLGNFERSEAALDALENRDEEEGLFLLYESARHSLDMAGSHEESDEWVERVESFDQRRAEAMQQLCSSGLYRACEVLGHIHVKRSEYESALVAFTTSAKNGSYTAMSAIVDLYRTDDWPGKSEEEARKWLLKIGKP